MAGIMLRQDVQDPMYGPEENPVPWAPQYAPQQAPAPQDPFARSNFSEVFNQMQPGEMLVGDGTDAMNATFISPAPNPNDPREAALLQAGWYDRQKQAQGPGFDSTRLNNIQDMTGATMQIDNPFIQMAPGNFSPNKAQEYLDLSTADKMALELVNSGRMAPEDWYATKKKDEMETRKAILEQHAKADPSQFNFATKDGKPLAASGDVMAQYLNGDVVAEITRPENISRQYINSSTTTNKTGGRSGSGVNARTTENESAWNDYKKLAISHTNAMSTATADSKWVTPEIKAAIDKQQNTYDLAVRFGSMDPSLSPSEAEQIAANNLTSQKALFASSKDPIVADSTGERLNFDGIVSGPKGEVPVVKMLLETNAKTGKLFTADELLQGLIKQRNQKRMEIFNSAVKNPIGDLYRDRAMLDAQNTAQVARR